MQRQRISMRLVIQSFMNRRRTFTPGQSLEKIRHYCAYQERSHFEVKEKLFSFGLNTAEVDQIMATLISDNYLNEERFATMFAGGKFRLKKWGRKRILFELKNRKVSDHNIRIALAAIDAQDYQDTINDLMLKKREQLIGEGFQGYELRARTLSYLIQKGFETALLQEAFNQLSNSDSK